VTVELTADRTSRDHAVLREIVQCEAPALGSNVLADEPAELPTVEGGRTLVGEQFERVGEIGHHEPVARDEAHIFGTEDRAARLGAPENDVEDRVQVGLRFVEHVPLPRDRDRRLEQAAPGKRRVGMMRGLEPGDRPWNSDRGGADSEDLRRAAVELDVHGLHLPRRAREPVAGNRDEEVVQPNSPRGRLADEEEAASARARERALGHPGHTGRGNARVDRVPAFTQHLGARLGGERVPGRHRAPHTASVTGASAG
jgi:hypothetical protein